MTLKFIKIQEVELIDLTKEVFILKALFLITNGSFQFNYFNKLNFLIEIARYI